MANYLTLLIAEQKVLPSMRALFAKVINVNGATSCLQAPAFFMYTFVYVNIDQTLVKGMIAKEYNTIMSVYFVFD